MSFKMTKFLTVVVIFLFFTVLCLAPSSDPWDGTGWDVTAPDIDQPHGKDYLELQDLRKGVAIRMNKEHVTMAASSAGGEHLNGSAVVNEGTTTPTKTVNGGSTALSDIARDRGRLWLDDNFDPPVLKRWDGSAWEIIGTIAAGSSPKAYMHNTTHEDTERGRESQIRAYGEQSGGEQSTLGYTEFSHDGTSDDQKGRYLIVLNDGDDDDVPSKIAIVFQADGTIDVGDSVSILDEDDMASDSATQLTTQQSQKAYADTKIAKDGSTAFTGTGDGFKDEDDMSSDSATAAASQQSIKAYVDATPHTGGVVQTVQTSYATANAVTAVIPVDDSIPQQSEGEEIVTLAITPTSATNKLKIEVVVPIGFDSSVAAMVALFQDSTANALAVSSSYAQATLYQSLPLIHYMTAGTTSETTFKIRAGVSSGTITINGIGGGRKWGGVCKVEFIITEYKS